VEPPLVPLAPGHQVACHFPENVDVATPTTAAATTV
jgi:peptide/nickel transport system ATP-binding protein/oligopeptide transport system ATP-binding protein